MANDMQVFNNAEFGAIRTAMIEGMPYFVGKDVAAALGYSAPTKAIRDRVDVEDIFRSEDYQVNGTPLTLINESGLYSLILTSKLPSAKEFKRWVTSSILPMIRKTGMYVTSEAISNGDSSVPMRTLTADDYLAAARLIASCKADRLKLVLSMLGKAGWEIGEQKYALTSGISTADIGPRIQKVLSERNMSWSELAEKTGVSADVLRSYRDGRRFPRPDRYVALVDVLDNLSAEDES